MWLIATGVAGSVVGSDVHTGALCKHGWTDREPV